MDLYASQGRSLSQKVAVIAIELALILLSAWILFGGGAAWSAKILGWTVPTEIPARRYVVLAFSLIIFIRVAFTMLYLLKRQMPWSEAATIPFAFALYYVGFAVLVLPHPNPLSLADYFAVALFAFGCILNTGSEIQRHRFKSRKENAERLYTGGLFRWSMHINFFGDVMWVTAYAMVAHSVWALAIPLWTLSFFVFYNVPLLDRHLAGALRGAVRNLQDENETAGAFRLVATSQQSCGGNLTTRTLSFSSAFFRLLAQRNTQLKSLSGLGV